MSEQRTTGSGSDDGFLQGAKPAPHSACTEKGTQKKKTTGAGPAFSSDGHVPVSKPGKGAKVSGSAGPKVTTGDRPANSGGGVTGFTGS